MELDILGRLIRSLPSFSGLPRNYEPFWCDKAKEEFDKNKDWYIANYNIAPKRFESNEKKNPETFNSWSIRVMDFDEQELTK